MLLSFRVTNHKSLRDEQHMLLTPAYAADRPSDADWEAVSVAGIFGPNASGKSNVIDAIAYMARLVRGSFQNSEPGVGVRRFPFALDPDTRGEPSVFEVDLMLDGVRHTYGFAVDDDRVAEEWLYSHPDKRKCLIFHRRDDEYSYGADSSDSIKQVEGITDANVLFISVASRTKQSDVLPVYDWFVNTRISAPGPMRLGILRAYRTPLDRRRLGRLVSLLRAADTGIERAEIVEEPEGDLVARVASEEYAQTGRRRDPRLQAEVKFTHQGARGDAALGFEDQSFGTRALYDLGNRALMALDAGAPLIVDEIDSSLHPYVTAQLIKLFRDPKTNGTGAQLIFTSHHTTLLGRIQEEHILDRDHIWFTEKDKTGATELFPLSAFSPRKDENRERRYLTGRYGAVPIVDDELFAAAVTAREDTEEPEPPRANNKSRGRALSRLGSRLARPS